MNETARPGRALTVSVPGGELIGVRTGSGRPLLVLHGGPAVNDYSYQFAAELAEQFLRAAHDSVTGRSSSGR
jgi:hypothetical protein